ncbi:MAG: chromosome segregation protein SMC [Tetrasphaera sp.]|nr:chromosome segregation protein SMC [Tetrasphaera sp.]
MSQAATTLTLLERAREGLLESYAATATSTRYLTASLAAMRAAAAVLAARPRPPSGSSGRHDLWQVLGQSVPELHEWAELFEVVTAERVAVETALVRVSAREADDVLRAAEEFLCLVEVRLGLPRRESFPLRLAPTRTA